MLITRKDPLTGKTNSLDLPVTDEQFQKWQGGDLIKSGLISESWDKLFPDDLDEDYVIKGIDSKATDNSAVPFIIDSPLPSYKDWATIKEDKFPPPPLAEKTWSAMVEDPIQAAGEREVADNEWVEESTPKKDKVEKQYRPPSSKIYSAKNVSYHKFHKVRPVYKYLNDNIYLAGGSLRTVLKCSTEEVNDFDLFFKSLDEVQPLYDRLLKDGFELVYSCPDGFLYSFKRGKHKIQLICEVEYATPYVLLNSFDVSGCIFCWHMGSLYFSREAVRSVFIKNLRVNNVTFPVATLKRIVKYAQKGYSVSDAAEDFCRQVNTLTNMRYRLTSDDDGHDYVIPSDKLGEWRKYLDSFYKAADNWEETPDEPTWAARIDGSSNITFENWKEE